MNPSFFVDLLFPRRCPVCDDIVMPKGRLICPACFRKLSFVKGPVCKKCGKEVMSENIEYCFDCVRHKRSFDYGLALLNYDETAKNSMIKIKYKNRREYLDFYGEAIAARYEKQIRRMNAGVLVPIPVHPKREREKGLDPNERLKNLEAAFVPGERKPGIEGAMLMDDIYTTGSTMEACTRVLKKAGIKRIYFLTICIGRGY